MHQKELFQPGLHRKHGLSYHPVSFGDLASSGPSKRSRKDDKSYILFDGGKGRQGADAMAADAGLEAFSDQDGFARNHERQYDLMKARPRSLQPRVDHSRIHSWGLFSSCRIEPQTFVIEYLGELIRTTPMSDVREAAYERQGLNSCYMFKIDEEWVVDATFRGNISRFINHSCDPNCYTRIVTVRGENKIVVTSSRVIFPGEEITYNYFFTSETEKLGCRCGAAKCSGRLN